MGGGPGSGALSALEQLSDRNRQLTVTLIPRRILTKLPSAELKPGQVAQNHCPLDDMLERLVQRHESVADMVAAGHDAAVVDKVVRIGILGRV